MYSTQYKLQKIQVAPEKVSDLLTQLMLSMLYFAKFRYINTVLEYK